MTVARNAKDLDLVLHIGLHKTASTYLQNVLSARRYDLIADGVLYPSTGMHPERPVRTRDGAQSGQAKFAGRKISKQLLPELLEEVPPVARTVILSAEDFSHPRVTPAQIVERFGGFRSIKVVLVLRRQDVWIESLYKQEIDQYYFFETRSLGDYLAEEGPALLDFHARFSPWRDLVGPENFHVVSYDDVGGGAEICRRVLAVAGVPDLDRFPGVDVPRYESVRAIDTLGLRLLNGYALRDREVRDSAAREIYAAGPAGDIPLLTPAMQQGIQARCAEINERIEAEWFGEPVPGFRFGSALEPRGIKAPSGTDMAAYFDQVLAICEAARAKDVVPEDVEA